MGRLSDLIRQAVVEDKYLVSIHADERCEERRISAWQLVAGLANAMVVRERPASKPNPSIITRQLLADGSEVEVVWSYLEKTHRAMLVTVYFREQP